MPRPTREQIAAAIQDAGSIRAAAPALGAHERTVRRWIKEDEWLTTEGVGMKILAIDIETSPNLAYVWDLWNQNVNLDALVERTRILCWAAKWVGEDGVEFRSEHHDGHSEMIQRAWDLVDEADVVLHYNGQKFDMPHFNREFILLGLQPPSAYKQIDLLKTAKRQFNFPSNKLQNVSEELGLAGKVKHEGFRLWLSCLAGDDDAWDRMRAYNIQDVVLLEELYERLKPWIPNHPSHAAMFAADICPTCGSDDLQPQEKPIVLKTASYQSFRCGECGTLSRSTRRIAGTTVTEVTK